MMRESGLIAGQTDSLGEAAPWSPESVVQEPPPVGLLNEAWAMIAITRELSGVKPIW